MDPSIILFPSIPYVAELLEPGQRKPSPTILAEPAPVRVRQVADDEAPIGVMVRWRNGRAPLEVAWRHFEGAFWRPILDPDNRIVSTIGEFLALLEASDGRAWRDYPFQLKRPDLGAQPVRPRRGLDENCRVVRDEQESAIGNAQHHADSNLIIVAGMLYQRSSPPVCGVGDPNCLEGWNGAKGPPVPVRVTALEFHSVRSIAYFGLNRRDHALEFARRLSDENPSGQQAWEPWGISRKDQHVELTLKPGVDLPDERVPSFPYAFENLRSALRGAPHGDLPSEFHEAYAAVIRIARKLQEGQSRGSINDLVAEGLKAIDVIIDTVPKGGDPWRWARKVEMIARAQKWRFEIEDPKIEQVDTDEEMGRLDEIALADGCGTAS